MRIVIGEDEALLREGLTVLLTRNGMTVVGTAGDADTLVAQTREHRPDLVLTDIRMPPSHTDDGLRAALRIRAEIPDTAVLVLSQHVQRRYALELLGERPSGVGYLLKQRVGDVESFGHALRRVADGGTALDPEVVAMMLQSPRSSGDVDRLTTRRREVLALLAEGRTNAAIARRLSISEKAVTAHVSGIYEALGLPPDEDDHRRVLAVVRYLADRA